MSGTERDRVAKLNELATVERGRSRHRPRNAEHLYGGPYPFVQTGEVKAADFWIHGTQQTYSEAGLAQSRLWPAGTICVTIAANIAESGMLAVDACFPDSVVGVTPLEGVSDASFLKYSLDYMKLQLQAVSGGTTQDNLSLEKLMRFDFPAPTIRAQCQIARCLRSFDDLIETNRRRIEILEELARLLYREWFVHFRFPGHEDVELVDSELGPFPEGWEVRRVSEVASVNKGLSYKGAHLVDDGLPMANLKCLAPAGGFARRGTKGYGGPFKERHAIVPGDIVVANTDLTQAGNVIGSAGMVPGAGFQDGGLLSHHLFRVRPETSPFTLLRALQSDRLRALARGVASGTTVLGMRSADFERFMLAWPPADLRSKFEAAQEPMHRLMENLEDQNHVLREARDLLLPRLVSGELDVSVLDLDGVLA